MYKLLLLSTLYSLVGCSTVNKYNPYANSGLNLLLNIPRYHEEMVAKEIRIRACFAANNCKSTWDPKLGYWIVTRIEVKQVPDPSVAQEEQEILDHNKLQAEIDERLKCIRAGLCVYVAGIGTRHFTNEELDDLQTRQSKDSDECIKNNLCIPYQIKGSPVILYRRYSAETLKSLESNDSYEVRTSQQEEQRLLEARKIGWLE